MHWVLTKRSAQTCRRKPGATTDRGIREKKKGRGAARDRKKGQLGGLIDKRGGPTVEQAPTVVSGRQLASTTRKGVSSHVPPQVGVCLDFDHKQKGPIREVPPPPFDGDEEGGDGDARFDSKIFGDCSNSEATITDYINTSGVWGVDTVIDVD
jgi:hypothetical protein